MWPLLLFNATVIWPLFGAVWLVGVFIGIPLTLVASAFRAYEWVPDAGDRNEGYWRYTWPFMKLWSTWDNGACAWWYHRDSGRSLWLDCWIYSGFRNAFGGNPFNAEIDPREITWRSDDGTGRRLAARFVVDDTMGEMKSCYWNVTRHKWRMGIHLLFPFSQKTIDRINRARYSLAKAWHWTKSKVMFWVREFPDFEPPKPAGRYSHFEIRHGWKLYPDVEAKQLMVFSLWDTGPRLR